MTTEELAQVWVPVPLRWRHVVPGDTFLDSEGAAWHATHACPWLGCVKVSAQYGPTVRHAEVDPDDVIDVLVPALERDAVELTREELGARLVARRTMEQG